MSSEKSYIIDDSDLEEGNKGFFFDTYAFYELINKNENYLAYLNAEITTTKLNIFELYFIFLKRNNYDLAKIALEKYYPFAMDFDEEVIAEAAKLKLLLNKRDVSMTDCIGYSLAKRLGVRFLTGDSAFEKMENVEFVR